MNKYIKMVNKVCLGGDCEYKGQHYSFNEFGTEVGLFQTETVGRVTRRVLKIKLEDIDLRCIKVS